MLSGKTILALSLLANQDGEYKEASDQARRALFMYPEVKAEFKALETTSKRIAKQYLGLEADDLVYGAWVLPLITQRITTRPFKKLKYEKETFVIRPEIVYNWGNSDFNGQIVLIFKLRK